MLTECTAPAWRLLSAVDRLDIMAENGSHPQEVAAEAERIALGWWWDARRDVGPDRLVLAMSMNFGPVVLTNSGPASVL